MTINDVDVKIPRLDEISLGGRDVAFKDGILEFR